MFDDSRRYAYLRPSLAGKKRKRGGQGKRGQGTSAAKKRKPTKKPTKKRKVSAASTKAKPRKRARKVQPRKGTKRASKSGSRGKGKRKAATKKPAKKSGAGHARKSKARPKKHSAKGKKTRVGRKPGKRKAAKSGNQRAGVAQKQKPSRKVSKTRKKHAGKARKKVVPAAADVQLVEYTYSEPPIYAVIVDGKWMRTPVRHARQTFDTQTKALRAIAKYFGKKPYLIRITTVRSADENFDLSLRVSSVERGVISEPTPREPGTELTTGRPVAPEPGEEFSTGADIVEERIRGQELSAEQLAPPGPARVPQYLAPNIYYVNIAKFDDYSERGDEEDEIERYMTSTAGMSKNNENYLAIFKQAFYDYVKKTPFEDVDDVPIYRFGLVIRSIKPRSQEALTKLIYQFRDFLKDMLPQGAAAHIVDEDKYISVRLGLGSNRRPSTFTQAHETMVRNRELLDNFREGTKDLIDDFVWFEFWDTEEDYAYQ